MKTTSKGQVTERFGLLSHPEFAFPVEGDRGYVEKVEDAGVRSRDLIRRMRGAATVRMATDEILDLTRSGGDAGGRGVASHSR